MISLRQASHSLGERRRKWQDDFAPYFLIVFAFLMVCVVESAQRIAGNRTPPAFWVFVATLVTAYGGCRAFRLFPALRRTALAQSGERTVADILDRSRAENFVVHHHASGKNPNVDHVVICPAGIYALKTKLRIGKGIIDYLDSDALVFGGRIRDALALRQARESGESLRAQLAAELKEDVPVKSLLVVVGDWSVRQAPGDFDVDVVRFDELGTYFESQQPEFTQKEIIELGSRAKDCLRANT